ncbi:MAG TPA: haloacid dehalogenase-like hydrolase [Phycisphaerales bacterium]|nr:haloacid dehalogenase-like hydrolase [Phycisphaerales bacterium]
MPGIVIFDVDGTLTASTGIDDACLCAAWERVLGARNIDTDWSNYQHSTDEGLTLEVCRRAHARAPRAEEMARVKQEFFALLRERTRASAACCPAVPGVNDLLAALRRGGWQIGIASGAWEESARIKLACAGVDVSGLPGTFAHAKPCGAPAAREEIVGGTIRELVARAPRPRSANRPDTGGTPVPPRPVYVGDGPWDARAARALGLGFVGVRVDDRHDRLRREGASRILRDYTNLAAALSLIDQAANDPTPTA